MGERGDRSARRRATVAKSNRAGRRRVRGVPVLGLVGALLASTVVVVSAVASPAAADPSTGFVDDVPSTTPSNLGDLDLTELQYADPTEALDLIQPPEAGADGGASLAHPLTVPPGRAGVAPDLALTYDSGGGSGWAGTGWDLGVGAVTVDTEFGAPRYLSGFESETYQLDGDRLFPNAIRTELEKREAGPRSDWVRQTEDDHDLITRHGDDPSHYCWEVADTKGNHRWYGGEPDGQGGCIRDETAILTAPATGAPGGVDGDFQWALTYVVDVSGNTTRFKYDELTGVPIGQGGPAIGVSSYLREILYTGFALDTADDAPAYRVTFLRDGDVTGDTPRRDVSVDAGSGLPVVTRDLLREVKVEYLPAGFYLDVTSRLTPPIPADLAALKSDTTFGDSKYTGPDFTAGQYVTLGDGSTAHTQTTGDSSSWAVGPMAGTPPPGSPSLVKGWKLEYTNGPFDKSLLSRVGQFGTGGPTNVSAWHEFSWFDDVRNDDGVYAGFGPPEQWGSGADSNLVNIAAESALGTSWRAGADGGAYIGFNPVVPSKVGSFGGSFNIAGGQSNDVSTLIDLNGDSLPDKVFLDGSSVMWRQNLRRPDATDADKASDGSWFGAAQSVKLVDSSTGATPDPLRNLGRSSDLKLQLHFEAYPAVSIQVGGGFAFSFGDEYFQDVNGDGRVDFVRPGVAGAHSVFFNVLIGGAPTFIDSSLANWLSTRLEVPLDEFNSTNADTPVAEVAELLVNTSPRIDTVRRWLAPHDGTIRVTGNVAFTLGGGGGDGAQVSIEHAGVQEWVEVIGGGQPTSMDHDEVFTVAAGEAVFFRVHVIQNAAGDEVVWDPTISYVEADEVTARTAAVDANGRSQIQYSASQDFTLFGRTGARTAVTDPGPLTVTVDVTTFDGGLSDDLEVLVRHGRGNTAIAEPTVLTVAQLTEGAASGATTFDVTAPGTDPGKDLIAGNDDDFDVTDWVEVDVRSDSPVDPTKFSVDINTSAPGSTPPDLSQLPADANVDIPDEIPIVPNVRVFARTDHVAPYEPVRSPSMETPKTSTVHVDVAGDASAYFGRPLSSPAVLTLKTLDDAVVARADFTISNQGFVWGGAADLNFTPKSNTDYYVDVSVANPAIGAAVDLAASTITFKWSQTEQDSNGNNVAVDKSSTTEHAGQLALAGRRRDLPVRQPWLGAGWLQRRPSRRQR